MLDAAVLRMLAMLDRRVLWHVPTKGNEVFLTFDDGPEPGVTPQVLDILAAHGAKATFFCIGEKVRKYPDLVARIAGEGHSVGHHTWDHADGWRTPAKAYFRSVLRGATEVGGPLFRPPYGHLAPRHAPLLGKRFQVVMWDVMGFDFKPGRTGKACARRVLRRIRPGSIIVLHDNLKSAACVKSALPLILGGISEKGFRAVALAPQVMNRPRR
ncbi:MAG: polysaccharide deacetylase family protein [Bacteroidetes bacterium]|nr:polysaccharide deacetylase family protein [Bacteroidota bacterium]MBS1941399.1 polysaccharide deacetylase family protein [Bacteroidota bacterium]